MKLFYFILLLISITIVLSGCPTIPPLGLPLEQIGTINKEDSLMFIEKIPSGTNLQDSISILYYDECYGKSFFKVTKIDEFTFKFTLIDKLLTEVCFNSSIIYSKVLFSFTPSKKGVYNLQIEDKFQTVFKTLLVE